MRLLGPAPSVAADEVTKGYVDAADTSTLTSAKSYTDGRETAITNAYKAADTTALNSAKAYTDTKVLPSGTSGPNDVYGPGYYRLARIQMPQTYADLTATVQLQVSETTESLDTSVLITVKFVRVQSALYSRQVTLHQSSPNRLDASKIFWLQDSADATIYEVWVVLGQYHMLDWTVLTQGSYYNATATWGGGNITGQNPLQSAPNVPNGTAVPSTNPIFGSVDYSQIKNAPTSVDKTYVDTGDSTTLASAKSYADTGDTNTLNAAKSYVDNPLITTTPSTGSGTGGWTKVATGSFTKASMFSIVLEGTATAYNVNDHNVIRINGSINQTPTASVAGTVTAVIEQASSLFNTNWRILLSPPAAGLSTFEIWMLLPDQYNRTYVFRAGAYVNTGVTLTPLSYQGLQSAAPTTTGSYGLISYSNDQLYGKAATTTSSGLVTLADGTNMVQTTTAITPAGSKLYTDSRTAYASQSASGVVKFATDSEMAQSSTSVVPSPYQVKSYADAGDSTTLTSAKNYADSRTQTATTSVYGLTRLATSSEATSGTSSAIAATPAGVKSYADAGDSSTLASAKSYADSGDSNTLSSAKSYADSGDSTTLSSAKSYSDTGNSNTLASAKSYTDSLAYPQTGQTFPVYNVSSPVNANGPSTYSPGVTISPVSAQAGFPTSYGTLKTTYYSDFRAYQEYTGKGDVFGYWMRAAIDSSTWSSWVRVDTNSDDTGWIASGFYTASTGITFTGNARIRRVANIVSVLFTNIAVDSLSVSTIGDHANRALCVLQTQYRPSIDGQALSAAQSGRVASFYVNSNGGIYMAATVPASTATGTYTESNMTVSLGGTYLLG